MWAVGREYRLRVQQRFKDQGIELGIPQRQIWHRGSSSLECES
jgi:small-conductance mechanosensitive channel